MRSEQEKTEELIRANLLMEQGDIQEAFQIVLKLEQMDNLKTQELLPINLLKTNLLCSSGDFLNALKIADTVFQESQKQGDLLSSFDALTIQAHIHVIMGNVSLSEEVIKKAEDLFKKIKETFTIDLRERESFLLRIHGLIYNWKGDVNRSLEFSRRAYELAKDAGNKKLITLSLNNVGNTYFQLKEYEKAIFYTKEAVKVNYESLLAVPLGTLMDIYINKGDIKEARLVLKQLSELKKKFNSKSFEDVYSYSKALLLKSSLRARDRIKSEDIFKELALKKSTNQEDRIGAFINLCDLLLIELRLTNYPEIIDEIQPYIQKLLNLAESEHLYLILAETYLLQAKLSLLTFDTKKAKRFLIQAKQIAERFGHKELAERITNEYSTLLKKSDTWKKLEEMGAPMAERIELAQLKEQIEEIVEKRSTLPAFITEEKVTIHKEKKICLICRGEVLRFTYICECGAIYCDKCARAVIDLENVCWVCDVPIDYSKPVKSYEEELDRIQIDKKHK